MSAQPESILTAVVWEDGNEWWVPADHADELVKSGVLYLCGDCDHGFYHFTDNWLVQYGLTDHPGGWEAVADRILSH